MRRIRYDFSWRSAHLAALLVLWAVGAAVLAERWVDRPIRFGGSLPVLPGRVATVEEKINPNTASIGSLLRLSGIGPVKAKAIADYVSSRGGAPFGRPEDLSAVSGIGPGTVERLRPYLTFGEGHN